MEPDNVVDKCTVCVKNNDVIVGHVPHGKNGGIAKMMFHFLIADKYVECEVVITGKEVNLGDGELMQVLFCWRFLEQKLCYKYFVKIFKINRNIPIYLFFQLLNQ